MKTTFSAICIFIAALVTMSLQAQTIKQHGVTYQYNGKNKRTPIGGVYIKAITANNGEVSDEKTGAFTLALNNLKMGSRIGNVRVTKQGMMVFNQQAVDEWSVRKDPLYLILCNAAEFQKQKDNLIAIGRNEAKKKYDKQLVELKKQNDAKQLQIDEYYNKLDSLEKEYQNALKHMDEYADVFARIDESEVDTIAQRAIEMFNRGEIEESIRLLESQNYLEKILKANRTIKQAEELISTAEQAKTLAEQDKQKFLEGVKTQIAGYKLQNEWDKAKELLKGLADELNTLEAIGDYAMFCYNQKDYIDAEMYNLKYKKLLQKDTCIDETTRLLLLLRIQNNLATLYIRIQRYSESETMYKTALETYKRLAEINSSRFESELAANLANLANLYTLTQRYSESEKKYKAALEIYKRLVETNPSVFEPELTIILVDFATFYKITQRYSESETMYKNALETYKRLSKANPSVFEPCLAQTQTNLAILYSETQRYQESETMYKNALEIYERLAKDNPFAFEPDLAKMQVGLANLYTLTQRYSESETIFKEVLKIQERLVKGNSSAFEPDLAETHLGLAILYTLTQCYSESEKNYKAALEIYKRLIEINPSVFEPKLARTFEALAILYTDIQRYSESEIMYKAVLEVYERLVKTNPQIYESELAECYYKLGCIMLLMEKYHAAICPFIESLNHGRNMITPGKITDFYWESLSFLIVISSSEKDYISAYKYNEELQLKLKELYNKDPEEWKSIYATSLIKQSFYSILFGKFQEGEQSSLEALKIDSTAYLAYTNLAAAMLFQGKTEEAEKLYRQYKGEFKDNMLDDFAEFERLGIIPKERKSDVERIMVILKE